MITNNLRRILLTMLAFMLFIAPSSKADSIPVISLSLPIIPQQIPDDAFADFEAQYGVRVNVIADTTAPYLGSSADDTQAYLNDLRAYAESADVIYVDSHSLNGIGAQTGFFLDLNPLANSDSQLNPADFYPAAWNAFQWDGQLLALPVSFNTMLLGYNASAFDALNLSYPSPNWTIDDFAAIARTLTQYDANGNVIRAGYESSAYDVYLIHAFVGQSLLDMAQFPATLNINNPELANILTIWNQLQTEGVIGQGDNMANTVSTMSLFASNYFNGSSASAALLPNNRAGIDVNAFAVSAGTRYPELAYALARALTHNNSVIAANFQTYASRTAMPTQHPVSQQVEVVLNQALTVSIPYADLRFADYLRSAMNSSDVTLSLTTIASNLQTAIQTAQQFGTTTTLSVNEAPNIGEGITLNFGVATIAFPLPNQEQWDIAIAEFINSDTEVSWIQLEGGFGTPETYPEIYDCFAISSSWIDALDPMTLLRIDPLIMQDASFNPDDFVIHPFNAANGEIYAYPLSITPRFLAVNTGLMGNQGIQIPENGWTIDQFTTAVMQWKQNTGTPAYTLDDSLDVLTLVAAYGGLPIDSSTIPPTINFTALQTVTAIQQVLDMARNGTLAYNSMVELTPMGSAPPATPIQSYLVSSTGLGLVPENAQFLNFPSGMDYTVASYGVLSGAISAQTQYAAACFRWLRFIAQQDYIFQSMPARYSMLNTPQSEVYAPYAEVLQTPNLAIIPYVNKVGSDDSFVLHYILNRAMDAYVLNGADLNAELQFAQTNAELYLQCRAGENTVQDCALSLLPDIQAVLR